MAKVKKSWEVLDEKQKELAIKEVVNFFSSERSEEIGIIAAENILDVFLQKVGIQIYNKGVEDSKNLFRNKFEETVVDIEATLKKFDS